MKDQNKNASTVSEKFNEPLEQYLESIKDLDGWFDDKTIEYLSLKLQISGVNLMIDQLNKKSGYLNESIDEELEGNKILQPDGVEYYDDSETRKMKNELNMIETSLTGFNLQRTALLTRFDELKEYADLLLPEGDD